MKKINSIYDKNFKNGINNRVYEKNLYFYTKILKTHWPYILHA